MKNRRPSGSLFIYTAKSARLKWGPGEVEIWPVNLRDVIIKATKRAPFNYKMKCLMSVRLNWMLSLFNLSPGFDYIDGGSNNKPA